MNQIVSTLFNSDGSSQVKLRQVQNLYLVCLIEPKHWVNYNSSFVSNASWLHQANRRNFVVFDQTTKGDSCWLKKKSKAKRKNASIIITHNSCFSVLFSSTYFTSSTSSFDFWLWLLFLSVIVDFCSKQIRKHEIVSSHHWSFLAKLEAGLLSLLSF